MDSNFGIFAGEVPSYGLYDENGVVITNPAIQDVATDSNGDELPGGSQGFPGYSPDNVVDRSRTNYGLYLDTELNISEAFMIAGAVRFEDYSDFGNTINVKLASRLKITDDDFGSEQTPIRRAFKLQEYFSRRFSFWLV